VRAQLQRRGDALQGQSRLTKAVVKAILQRSEYAEYSRDAYRIVNRIRSQQIPAIPKEVQEKMKLMFKQTQKPFSRICPNNRTNFLSYSYVIRKFLEILSQHEYIEYFPLLKSREKLYHQDLMWKSICRALGWKYVPSI
jgi:hypothetical protein